MTQTAGNATQGQNCDALLLVQCTMIAFAEGQLASYGIHLRNCQQRQTGTEQWIW